MWRIGIPLLGQIPIWALLLAVMVASPAHAADEVRIWVKAFIPNDHPGNPGYVRRAGDGATVIPAPPTFLLTPAARALTPRFVEEWINSNDPGRGWRAAVSGALANLCFRGDQRDFSPDPNASARLSFGAALVVDGSTARIDTLAGRQRHFWSEPTHMVDCRTGQVRSPPATSDPYARLLPFGGSQLGEPRVVGDEVRLFVKGGAGNPLTPVPEQTSPSIDFKALFTYHRGTRRLSYNITGGVFPALEAYASLNGGPARRLISVRPADGTTVWNLVDLDAGVNTRTWTGSIDLSSTATAGSNPPPPRPVIGRPALERAVFVAGVLSLPGEQSLDAALLAGVADAAAGAGLDAASTRRQVEAARAALETQSRRFAEGGLDLGLDRAALLRRKAEVLMRVDTLRANAFIEQTANDLRRLGSVPSSALVASADLSSAADRLLRDALERTAARLQAGQGPATAALSDALLSQIGFRPGDGLEQIVAQVDHIAADPLVRALRDASRGGRISADGLEIDDALLRAVGGSAADNARRLYRGVVRGLEALTTDGRLGTTIEDTALSALSDATGIDARRTRDSVARLAADGLTFGTADAGLYLASTVGGLIDPKLGRDVARFGSAALAVARAVNGYGASAGMGNAVMGLGAAAMTGNVLGGAMALAGLLGGGGGDDGSAAIRAQLDEIKQEIGELRRQVEALSKRMDERFDRVDATLRQIHGDMLQHFATIERALSDQAAVLQDIDRSIADLSARMDAFERSVARGFRELRADLQRLATSHCLYWRTEIAAQLGADDFSRCTVNLVDFATTAASDETAAGRAAWIVGEAGLAGRLDEPHVNIRTVLAAARSLGEPLLTEAEQTVLPNPHAWAAAATNYVSLVRAWPDLSSSLIRLPQLDRLEGPGLLIDRTLAALGSPGPGQRLLARAFDQYARALVEVQLRMDAAAEEESGRRSSVLPTGDLPIELLGPTRGVTGLTFPQHSRMIPGWLRRLVAGRLVEVRVLGIADLGGVERAGDTGRVYVDVPLVLEARPIGSGEWTRVWRVEVRLPETYEPVAIAVRTLPDGTSTTGITIHPPTLQGWVRTAWPAVRRALENVDDPSDTAAARNPSAQPELVRLRAVLRQVVSDLQEPTARPTAPSVQPGPVVVILDQSITSGDTAASTEANRRRLVEMRSQAESIGRVVAWRSVTLANPVPEARLRLDAYAGLVRALVRLGFAEEIRRNDLLLALTSGEAQLVDGSWLEASRDAGGDPRTAVEVGAKRALALWGLLSNAASQRASGAGEAGDPSHRRVLAEVRSLIAERERACASGLDRNLCRR